MSGYGRLRRGSALRASEGAPAAHCSPNRPSSSAKFLQVAVVLAACNEADRIGKVLPDDIHGDNHTSRSPSLDPAGSRVGNALPQRAIEVDVATQLKPSAMIIIACLGVLGCGCAGESRAVPDSATHPPNVYRDIGAFFRDEVDTLAWEFTVHNNSRRAVRFVEIRTSCGCAKAELSAMALNAGQEATLRLEADTSAIGEEEKVVQCDLVSDNGELWRYRFRAMLYPRVRVEPGSLFFGSVGPLKPVERTVSLLSYAAPEDEPFRPAEVEIIQDEGYLQVSFPDRPKESDKVSPGVIRRYFPVQVRLNPQNRTGPRTAQVEVICKNGSKIVRLIVPVVWRVPSRYVLDPPRAFFGRIVSNAGSKPTMNIRISRADQRPFRIEAVSVPDASVRFRADANGLASEHSLVLEVDPLRIPRVLWGNVTVKTDHLLEPEITIPLSAMRAQIADRMRGSDG